MILRAQVEETSDLKTPYFSSINHQVINFEEIKHRKLKVLFYSPREN